jgi:phosphate-selective porin OprO/OprP
VTRVSLAIAFALGLPAFAAAQAPAASAPAAPAPGPAAHDAAGPAASDVEARWSPRPRVSGRRGSLELRGRLQGDTAWFSPVVDAGDEGFVWRRRRIGVRGQIFDRVSFEVEREFGDEDEPWRDVWVNLRAHDLLEVRGGKFKAPFGLDNGTSSTEHDFVFRSLGTRSLVPGREVGVMAHGAATRRRLTYAVGVFDAEAPTAGTPGFFDDDQGGDSFDRVVSGRVTVQPLDTVEDLPRGLRNLEVGLNAARSTVPVGRNSIKGRSVFGYEFFDRVYVNGTRMVAGVDVALLAGPASLKAEWISSSDERLGQGVGDVDLSKVVARGWYVAGTWLVTGEEKDESVVPKRPLLAGGVGALEVMARYERFAFSSAGGADQPASTSPRGDNLARNHDDVVTVGLAWHLTRWVKLQGNAIHESFLDPVRAPLEGTATYWSYVTRLQFAF